MTPSCRLWLAKLSGVGEFPPWLCVHVKMEVAGTHWNFLLLGASLLSLQADFSASVDWCGSHMLHSAAPTSLGAGHGHAVPASGSDVPGGGVLTLPFQWPLINAFGPFLF